MLNPLKKSLRYLVLCLLISVFVVGVVYPSKSFGAEVVFPTKGGLADVPIIVPIVNIAKQVFNVSFCVGLFWENLIGPVIHPHQSGIGRFHINFHFLRGTGAHQNICFNRLKLPILRCWWQGALKSLCVYKILNNICVGVADIVDHKKEAISFPLFRFTKIYNDSANDEFGAMRSEKSTSLQKIDIKHVDHLKQTDKAQKNCGCDKPASIIRKLFCVEGHLLRIFGQDRFVSARMLLFIVGAAGWLTLLPAGFAWFFSEKRFLLGSFLMVCGLFCWWLWLAASGGACVLIDGLQ